MCVCVRHREFLQASTQELDRNRGLDAGGVLPSRVQVLEPSVGEERAVLLGFSMMAFSVLMLFVVGVTTVQPYLSRYCRARTSQSGHVFFNFILEGSGMSLEPVWFPSLLERNDGLLIRSVWEAALLASKSLLGVPVCSGWRTFAQMQNPTVTFSSSSSPSSAATGRRQAACC